MNGVEKMIYGKRKRTQVNGPLIKALLEYLINYLAFYDELGGLFFTCIFYGNAFFKHTHIRCRIGNRNRSFLSFQNRVLIVYGLGTTAFSIGKFYHRWLITQIGIVKIDRFVHPLFYLTIVIAGSIKFNGALCKSANYKKEP